MPGWVESPQVSSARAGVDRAAIRGTARGRVGTLLIAIGVLTVCVASPAAMVWAQAPPPGAGTGQTVDAQEADQAAPPQPEPSAAPPPPSTGTPAPDPGAPSDPGTSPDDATPPPPVPVTGSSTSVSTAGSASVSAGDNFFAPPSITIQVGETVTWSNDGQSAHTVTANGGSFDSGNLNPGQSFSHTFSQAGTFGYYCQYHRSLGMKGTVTVQASGSGGGGGGGSPSAGAGGSETSGSGATGPSSESAAGSSPTAAGSSSQLPSTGLPLLPLLAGGAGLLLAGALLRRRTRVS
jgi:plastocyanin